MVVADWYEMCSESVQEQARMAAQAQGPAYFSGVAMKFTKTLAVASVAFGMALVSAAASAAVTFTLDSGTTNSGTTYGNTRASNGSDGAAGVQLTASAWANTGAGAVVKDAYLSQYSGNGLGVCNRTEGASPCPNSPNHAIDNSSSTALDSVLLSFNSAVNLSSINIGWAGTDTDFSVLYYTGGVPVMANGVNTYASMVSGGGWTLLGHYSNPGTGSEALGNASVFATYWLVSAYNTAFGGTLLSSSNYNYKNDAFKLKSVIVEVPVPTTQSPEPATLALLGLGLAGIGFARRRRK